MFVDHSLDELPLDPGRRFVRIREVRSDGYVVFDFAMGHPELHAELILPRSAFETFARLPGTEVLSDALARDVAAREFTYLYGEPATVTPDITTHTPRNTP